MFLKILFLSLISQFLIASTCLKSHYTMSSNVIKISDILDANDDKVIFYIPKTQYTKTIRASRLVKILKHHGYNVKQCKTNYVRFRKKSPINTDAIKEKLTKLYLQKYPNIHINSLTVTPRSYVAKLPKRYTLHVKDKMLLSHKGICYIKTLKKKEIFFNILIDATLDVIASKSNIKRGEAINKHNTTIKHIYFDRFFATPLFDLSNYRLQAKHYIKQGKIITTKDVTTLRLVKRGQNILAIIHSGGVLINFSAKALQDGKLGDTITIQKSNKKRLKAVVIGKNKVEIK